jgi:hypothetical protein
MKRAIIVVLAAVSAVVALPAQQRNITDFFDTFTAEWIRMNPDQATSTRFFTGEEQRRLERQLTPVTRAERVGGIQPGLAQ